MYIYQSRSSNSSHPHFPLWYPICFHKSQFKHHLLKAYSRLSELPSTILIPYHDILFDIYAMLSDTHNVYLPVLYLLPMSLLLNSWDWDLCLLFTKPYTLPSIFKACKHTHTHTICRKYARLNEWGKHHKGFFMKKEYNLNSWYITLMICKTSMKGRFIN